ncbi:MAG: hypothetical protein HYX75_05540 [Acidobacteria bacterium]|nr:hypothetical protein [Acidobacteriota bacterium]
MNKAALWIISFAMALPGGANAAYVKDPATDDLLHVVEDFWNETVGDSKNSPDFTGSLSSLETEYVSDNGDWTVTLGIEDLSFSLDLGELDFSSLHPREKYKCKFRVVINSMDVAADARLAVRGPDTDLDYACENMGVGMQRVAIEGKVWISGNSVGLEVTGLDTTQGDYYLTLPCLENASALRSSAGSGVEEMLLRALRDDDSNFNSICRKKIGKKLKSTLKSLLKDAAARAN